jgi:hypothetical protein
LPKSTSEASAAAVACGRRRGRSPVSSRASPAERPDALGRGVVLGHDRIDLLDGQEGQLQQQLAHLASSACIHAW